MTTSTSVVQINGLSSLQVEELRECMIKKLTEIDPFVDASLVVGYLIVLLGNGNGQERIEKELSDFLSPSLATNYSHWIFDLLSRMRKPESLPVEKMPLIEGRAFKNAIKALGNDGNSVHMMDDGQKINEERVGKKIFSSASAKELRSKRFGTVVNDIKSRTGRVEKHSNNSRDDKSRRIVRQVEQRERRDSKYDSDLDRRPSRNRDVRDSLSKGRLFEKVIITVENDRASRKQSNHKMYKNETEPEKSEAMVTDNVKKQVKCSHWPNCKIGLECPYVHPTDPCKYFPNCSFGEKCLNIHPSIPCKFQDRCQNPNCNYQHSSPACLAASTSTGSRPFTVNNNPYQPPSAITCRFFPNCKNADCPFVHPNSSTCVHGAGCLKPACPFQHPPNRSLSNKSLVNAPCRYGKNCSKSDCPFQHPSVTAESSMMEIDMLPSATSPMS